MNAAGPVSEYISMRSFGIGMAAALCVLAGLAAYAALRGEAVLSARSASLPAQSAAIDWPPSGEAHPIRPDNYIAIDIPAVIPDDGNDTDAAQTTAPHTEDSAADAAATDLHVTDTPVTDTPVTDMSAHDAAVTDVMALPDPVLGGENPAAPLPGLFENTQWGRLPVIDRADKTRTPFNVYRRPFDRAGTGGRPVISLAVFDLGLSDSATTAALRGLPPEVSLILSPYTAQPDLWIAEARGRGHEIWLSLPMQGRDYPLADPGPQTLLIGAAERDNLEKIYWTMGRATNYAGFVTPADAAFMKAEQDMRPVLSRIYGRGLGFIDASLMPSPVPQSLARSMDAAYGTADIWIDAPAERAAIADALAQLERLARKQGTAAAILRPYPLSYHMVQEWIATLPDKGIVLAPLSAQTGR